MTNISPVLCIGQSDSSAGTGIQADIKTLQAFGGYAASVVTAVSAQNTEDIKAMHPLPPIMVYNQIKEVMDDFAPKVIKTGMLANAETIDMIGDLLDDRNPDYDTIQVVVDPVMTSPSRKSLLDKEARDALKRRLLVHADILTPNISSTYELSGIEIKDIDDMCHAAETLRTLGAKIVVIKGGALANENVFDVLADDNGTEIYKHPVIKTKSTCGVGTTLSAGIAAGLAQGKTPRDAYVQARAFIEKAMKNAIPIGKGFGPLNHTVKPD